jgi:hypothetical protein
MAFDSSDIETRILTLERKIFRIRQNVDDLATWRISAVEQQLAALWMLGPKRQAQLVGEVDGCTSHGFPGAAVAVKDHASGNTLGTATCDSAGKYEVWANLDTDPQSLDVVATPTGAHAATFAASATQNVPTAHAGGNAVPTFAIPPASGWCCGSTDYFPSLCPFNWKFHINGCAGTGVAGVLIEIRQGGVLINSCTTADGTGGTTIGECTMASVPAGSYDITITGPTGKGFATQTFTASATTLTTRTLAADTGYLCLSLCNNPIPKTLYYTDSLGTHTLTWNGSAWAGTGIVTSGVVGSTCVAGGTMTVNYAINASLGSIAITWRGLCCNNGSGISNWYAADTVPAGTSGLQSISDSGSRTSFTCDPVSVTFNVSGAAFGSSCPGVGPAFGSPGGSGSKTATH